MLSDQENWITYERFCPKYDIARTHIQSEKMEKQSCNISTNAPNQWTQFFFCLKETQATKIQLLVPPHKENVIFGITLNDTRNDQTAF